VAKPLTNLVFYAYSFLCVVAYTVHSPFLSFLTGIVKYDLQYRTFCQLMSAIDVEVKYMFRG